MFKQSIQKICGESEGRLDRVRESFKVRNFRFTPLDFH